MLDLFGTAFPFTFSWTGPNGFSATNQDIFNLVAGTYMVTVTDANGNSTLETYVINEPPTLIASISQSVLELAANVSGGIPPYTYTWNTGDTLSTITPSSNGIYDCDVKDKAGCIINIVFTVTNVPTGVLEFNSERKFLKITNILGKEIKENRNELLFYIYDDGTVEKKIIIE